jgi:hypothetical protein
MYLQINLKSMDQQPIDFYSLSFLFQVSKKLGFLNHGVVLESSFVQTSAHLELSFSLGIILHFKCFFRPILVLKCDQGFVGYKASFRGLCLFYPIHFCHLRRTNKPFLCRMDHWAAESEVFFLFFSGVFAALYIIMISIVLL